MSKELKKDTRKLRKSLKNILRQLETEKIDLLKSNAINYTANNILRSIDLEMKLNKQLKKDNYFN